MGLDIKKDSNLYFIRISCQKQEYNQLTLSRNFSLKSDQFVCQFAYFHKFVSIFLTSSFSSQFLQSFFIFLNAFSQYSCVSYIIMFNNFTSQKEYQSCNVIVEASEGRGSLLIGDFNAATDQSTLMANSVKTVITAAAGLDHLQIPSSVTHIVYPLQDSKNENIKSYFDECFVTIDRKLNEGGVLVHCAAGISRSATLVIAFIMRKNEIGFKPAISLVRSKRSGICPNLGFEMQLKKYQADLSMRESNEPKMMKKNVSQKLSDDRRISFDVKKIDNFDFHPLHQNNKKKLQQNKKPVTTITRHTGYSKPKQRPLYDVAETELFISGKSAKRPASQIRNSEGKQKTPRVNSLMGTWGPSMKKSKHIEF